MNELDLEKRLDKIDNQLDSIQQLMLETKLQQKDIDLLKEEVKQLRAEQEKLKTIVDEIKHQPTKDKASKWSAVEKWIFGGVLAFLAGCVAYIIKTGLVGNVIK